MCEIRKCVKELFEISTTDYSLAKTILEKSSLKFRFEEISHLCGNRNSNVQHFIEEALLYIDETSFSKELLLRKIKESVLVRTNICIHLLLKYKATEIAPSDILLFNSRNSWEANTKMISSAALSIKLGDNLFDELMKAYISGNSTGRELSGKMLLRLPKTGVDYDYINKNKFNDINYVGEICRLLFMSHYEDKLSNDVLLKMFRKDYYSSTSPHLIIFTMRVSAKSIPKPFWEKCYESNHFELQELARTFLPKYEMSALQKSEMELFLNKYSL